MSLLSTTMSSSQADIVDCTDSVDFRNNVIIMEVDNLLVGWPVYKIKFMPKNTPMVSRYISSWLYANSSAIETHHSS